MDFLPGLEGVVVRTGCQHHFHRKFITGEDRVHVSMPRLLGLE